MKFLDDFKNKTYSKSFYFIVFFNYIYLYIFLGLISTYLTKIKFFKGEKYV